MLGAAQWMAALGVTGLTTLITDATTRLELDDYSPNPTWAMQTSF
jgi:hypothetical protein